MILLLPSLILFPSLTGGSCGAQFNSATTYSGEFTSPHYPKPYPNNMVCEFVFEGTVDERIRIIFTEFDLEDGTSAGCLYDYVDVFTIDINRMKYLEYRFCGNKTMSPIVSIHPRVELVFKSNYQSNGEIGFRGRFEFVGERWQPFPPSDPECGPGYLDGVGGVLTSPGFPAPYSGDIHCTWMIRVQQEQRILLNFDILDLGQSVSCQKTYAAIYDGFGSEENPPKETVCGQLYFYNQDVIEMLSKMHRVVIRFVSTENELKSSGFRISWTAVKFPDILVLPDGTTRPYCPEFICAGGESCIDANELFCAPPLPQYCISDSLRCNDMLNCGAYDHSDEAGCFFKIFIISLAIGGPILLLIFIIIIVCLCRMRRRRRGDSHERKGEMNGKDVPHLENSPGSKRQPGINSADSSPIKNPVVTYCPSPRYQYPANDRYYYSPAPNGNMHYPSDPNLCASLEFQQTYVSSRSSPMIAQQGRSPGRSPVPPVGRSPGAMRAARGVPYRMMENLNSTSVTV